MFLSKTSTRVSDGSVDYFGLSDAIREHNQLRKSMEMAFRSRHNKENEEREHARRQQLQNQAANAHHLTRMKTSINKSNHGAPPSTASLFEVDLEDKRRAQPRHANCEIVYVRRWAQGIGGGDSVSSTPRRRSSVAAENAEAGGSNEQPSSILPPLGHPSAPPTGSVQQATFLPIAVSPPHASKIPTKPSPRANSVRRVSVTYGGGLVHAAELPSNARDRRQSLPSIQPIGGLTPKIIVAAETDFRMLSYGETHIPISVFDDLSPDLVLEFVFGRRTPLFQFRTYVEQHSLTSVSFPQFLNVVFGSATLDECTLAVRRWSPTFGWAAQLSEPVARTLSLLWKKWTAPDGAAAAATSPSSMDASVTFASSLLPPQPRPFTLDVFLAMMSVSPRDEPHRASMELLFHQGDTDGDGQWSREEFTAYFAKGMQHLGSLKKEKSSA